MAAEEIEKEALKHASNMAGDYIEYLKKTDMALFSQKEWSDLVECIGLAYEQRKAELLSDQVNKSEPEIPY